MSFTSFSGASETIVLNMSKLVVSVLANVKGRHALASEVTFLFPYYSLWIYSHKIFKLKLGEGIYLSLDSNIGAVTSSSSRWDSCKPFLFWSFLLVVYNNCVVIYFWILVILAVGLSEKPILRIHFWGLWSSMFYARKQQIEGFFPLLPSRACTEYGNPFSLASLKK